MPWRLRHGKEVSNLIFDTCLIVAARCPGCAEIALTTVAVDIYQQKSDLLILSEERFLKMWF